MMLTTQLINPSQKNILQITASEISRIDDLTPYQLRSLAENPSLLNKWSECVFSLDLYGINDIDLFIAWKKLCASVPLLRTAVIQSAQGIPKQVLYSTIPAIRSISSDEEMDDHFNAESIYHRTPFLVYRKTNRTAYFLAPTLLIDYTSAAEICKWIARINTREWSNGGIVNLGNMRVLQEIIAPTECIEYWNTFLLGLHNPRFLDKHTCKCSESGFRSYSLSMDQEVQSLREIGKEIDVSEQVIIEALWAIVYAQHCGSTLAPVFTSSRYSWGTQPSNSMGFFNTKIPLNVNVDTEESFRGLCLRINEYHFKTRHYGTYNGSLLKSQMRHGECFSVNLEFSPIRQVEFSSLFPLTIVFDQQDRMIYFKYDPSIDGRFIQTIADHLLAAMTEMCDPCKTVSSFRLLLPKEKQELLALSEPSHSSKPRLIHQLLEEHAIACPLDVAVEEMTGRKVTVFDLNAEANSMAHGLVNHYHVTIGVLMNPSIEMVACLFGILKSGNSYVILDPEAPIVRMKSILEDSNIPLVICDQQYHYMHILCKQYSVIRKPSHCNNLDLDIELDSIAYYVYTSGTTGKPKGVALSHAGASNGIQCYKSLDGKRSLLFYNPVFPAAQRTLLSTIINGGVLCIAPRQLVLTKLGYVLQAMRINVVGLTSSTLLLLSPFDEYPDLQQINLTGERVQSDVIKQWVRKCTINNCYGVSEIAQINFGRPILNDYEPLTCGRPNDTTSSYVLRLNSNELAPKLILGELCLGGAQHFMEYRNHPEITSKSLVRNPYGPGKMFRTGDLAMVHLTGEIQLLSRSDFQVKINGQRVELEEINGVIRNYPGVMNVSVVGAQIRGRMALAAHVELHSSSTNERDMIHSLKQHVSSSLPGYMHPMFWKIWPSIPKNSNGKTNVKVLIRETETLFLKDNMKVEGDRPDADSINHPLLLAISSMLDILPESISLSKSFLELGGSSVDAMRVSMKLAENHLTLQPGVLIQAPTLKEVLESLRVSDPLQTEKYLLDPSTILSDGVASDFEELYYVSPFQEGILASTFAGSTDYMYQRVFDIRGLDLKRLFHAVKETFEKSDILRTTFFEWKQSYVQGVNKAASIEWINSELPLNAYLRQDKSRGVSPGGAFVRVGIIGSTYFVLTMHHTLFDYWSNLYSLDDVALTYYGLPMVQRPTFRNYISYLCLDRDLELERWKDVLEGSQKTVIGSKPDVEPHCVSTRVSMDLEKLERIHKITLGTLIYTIWSLILHQQTHNTNVLFSITMSGRNKPFPGIGNLNGPTLEVCPMHIRLCHSETLKQLFEDVGQQFWHLAEIAYVGLKRALSVHEYHSKGPLLDTMVNVLVPKSPNNITESLFKPIGTDGFWYSGITTLEAQRVDSSTVDLRLISTLERSRATYILESFTECLNNLDALLEMRPESIYIQPRKEATIIRSLKAQAGIDRSFLYERFECFAQNFGSNIAFESLNGGSMTYIEAYREANQISRMLWSKGIRPGEKVPMILEKSVKAVLFMLGIMKAGAAFIPLSPNNPLERNLFVMKKVHARFVVVDSAKRESFNNVTAISTDSDYATFSTEHFIAPDSVPEDPAYLIFTSGSTGEPKGVIISHCASASSVSSMIKAENRSSDWRCLQFASFNFDASVQDIFNTLSSGGCLCMAPTNTLHSELVACINTMRINSIILTPTVAKLFGPGDVPNLRTLILGGEAMTTDIVKSWAPHVTLLNVYGPTETSMVVTTKRMTSNTDPRNIGRPLETVGFVLLDLNSDRIAPVGCIGELGIFGPQLADGYIGDHEKTRRSFIVIGGERIYRTGDIVRYDESEDLIFLGRKDTQVKVHGHRIELGEIEQAAMYCDALNDCITLYDESHGEALLVFLAHFKDTEQDMDVMWSSLMDCLRSRLPSYMIPSIIIPMSEFPRLPSQKIDRKRLKLDIEQSSTHELRAKALKKSSAACKVDTPTTSNERLLCSIISDILEHNISDVGTNLNFVELGGDSILAIKLVTHLKRSGLNITVGEVLESLNIKDIAKRIRNDLPQQLKEFPQEASKLYISETHGLPSDSIDYIIPCPPGQAEFWMQGEREEQYWTLMTRRMTPENFDITRWINTVERLTSNNGILRSTFFNAPQGLIQVVLKQPSLDLQFLDYVEDAHDQTISEIWAHRFVTGKPPILYRIVDHHDGKYEIIIKLNHALYDGQLLRIFDEQFKALWDGKVMQHPKTSFETYALTIWNKSPDRALSYWRRLLAQKPIPWPNISNPKATNVATLEIEEQNIRSRASAMQVTVAVLFQSAFQKWIAGHANTTDISYDLLSTGRDVDGHAEAECINGTCANFIPFRMETSNYGSVKEYVQMTQSLFWKATEASYVGLDQIYSYLEVSRQKMGSHALYLFQPFLPSLQKPSAQSWIMMAGSDVSLTQPYGIVFETSLTHKGYRFKLYFDSRVFSPSDAQKELDKIRQYTIELLN